MQIEATFRRRALATEDIFHLKDRLIELISQVPELWAAHPKGDVVFDPGTGESAGLDLTPRLATGIKGAVMYASRLPKSVVDKATSDDVMTLELRTEIVEMRALSYDIFSAVVAAFGPYRAAVITDPDRDAADFEEICMESARTGQDVDGRDSVFRIWPVNFFDEVLCKRAFGIAVDEVVSRLSGKVETAQKISGGALIVVAGDHLVTGDELDVIDESVRQLLA